MLSDVLKVNNAGHIGGHNSDVPALGPRSAVAAARCSGGGGGRGGRIITNTRATSTDSSMANVMTDQLGPPDPQPANPRRQKSMRTSNHSVTTVKTQF